MKTFKEFVSLCEEVEDKSKALGFQATIRKQDKGGRIGRDRTLPPTVDRMRGDDPHKQQKPRKDIGIKRGSRYQAPTQPRGSAALSPKEAQRKAYLERKEREAGKKTPTATELLSKAKPEVDKRPKDQPKRPPRRKVHVGPEYEGLTPREADKVYKRKIKSAGRKLLKSINPRIKDDEQSKKARS